MAWLTPMWSPAKPERHAKSVLHSYPLCWPTPGALCAVFEGLTRTSCGGEGSARHHGHDGQPSIPTGVAPALPRSVHPAILDAKAADGHSGSGNTIRPSEDL
jgi:hypothetical protein